MQEDNATRYQYAVVQFLQLPYADIGDYTCVPYSWIRGRRQNDRRSRSLVAYPDESPQTTKMRIMNGDEPSENWDLYMAVVKFESHSYEIACEFIMNKMHHASKKRRRVGGDDYTLHLPATKKRYSRRQKTIEMPDHQLKINRSNLKVVDKLKLRVMTSNSKKLCENNVKSRASTSSETQAFISPENVEMKTPHVMVYRDQLSPKLWSSSDDLLLRYPYLQQIPEKSNRTHVNSQVSGSRSRGKTLFVSKDPLRLIEQICDDSQKPQENQPLSIGREHLHQFALTRGKQDKRIPNLRTFSLDFSYLHPEIRSNTSVFIQNPTDKTNQFSQQEILESLPAIQEHPQFLPKQMTPERPSEVVCDTSEPTVHSKITNALHASIADTNLAQPQDSIGEDIVVDELTEASCIEQNDCSRTRTGNELSANPKAREEVNDSGQTIESSMEEESSMVKAATTSETSSTQDVDVDSDSNEQSISSDEDSDEIITTKMNSNESANQSVTAVLDQANVWADKICDIFQEMQINMSSICQFTQELQESLVESHKVIECIANSIQHFRAAAKEVTMEAEQITEEKQAEKKQGENIEVNMEEEKEDSNVDSKRCKNDDDPDKHTENVKDQGTINEVPKKVRGHIRTFVLPPEYDPDDTRWTLKYRENDPKLNLVELVEGSNVFVNSLRLAHCKLTAKDSKELARMLLVEVYSLSALSVCSLTGVKANAFDISGTNIRPGLDERARMTILTFVEKHARQKKWNPINSETIKVTLRSKIQDIRARHGKTA